MEVEGIRLVVVIHVIILLLAVEVVMLALFTVIIAGLWLVGSIHSRFDNWKNPCVTINNHYSKSENSTSQDYPEGGIN